MKYIQGKTLMYMDSGLNLEWVTLYIKDPKIYNEDNTIGIQLSRKAAKALIDEISARLFNPTEISFKTIITEVRK